MSPRRRLSKTEAEHKAEIRRLYADGNRQFFAALLIEYDIVDLVSAMVEATDRVLPELTDTAAEKMREETRILEDALERMISETWRGRRT